MIYELHIGALGFGHSGEGNLADAMRLLDEHLVPLGVNAVELMPIAESVLTVLNQLRQLIGQPPSTDVPYSAWSFNEVISMFGLTLPPHHGVGIQSPWSEPPGLESALKDFLSYTPPYEAFYAMGQPMTPIPLPSGSLYAFLTGVNLRPVARQGVGTH